jgi:hypothetical protein
LRTVLYSACYLEGNDSFGNSRLERTERYLKYYRAIKEEIGFEKIFLLDNSSTWENLKKLGGSVYDENNRSITIFSPSDLFVYRCRDHLERGNSSGEDYPYCWRALYFINTLIDQYRYEKIISIDTDCFVVSNRLAQFTRYCVSGWHTLYCQKYKFPEASFHILNQDAFPVLEKYTEDRNFMSRNGKVMIERDIPFTKVHKQFDCDRYGEDRIVQKKGMDLYAQAPLDIKLTFR